MAKRSRSHVVQSKEGGDVSFTREVNVPSPPPVIDIFSQFQKHRNDFEGEWIFMLDSEASATPSMDMKVKRKLKEHQQVFQQDRSDPKPEKPTTVTTGAVEKSESGSDEEYAPEDLVARVPDNEISSSTTALEADRRLEGDYLVFTKKEKQVSAGDLRIAVGGDRKKEGKASHSHSQSAASSSFGSHQSTTTPGIAMPLWAAKRLEQYGGYVNAEKFPTIALHQEILDFVDFIRPSEEEVGIRRFIELEVRRIATSLWPECEVVVYGSLRTQLLLPSSDVDITLDNVPVSPEVGLPMLAKAIDEEKFTDGSYPLVILKTKVPLVKFQHAGSLVGVDISIGALDGKSNTELVVELLDTFPEARPLILLIKYFLQQRDLDEPYRGGAGSYVVTLLVISFLQHHPIYSTAPEERPRTGLGKLLVDFLRYYGMYWNYQRCAVSLRGNAGWYPMRPFLPTNPVSPVASSPTRGGAGGSSAENPQIEIEDPNDPENNAGRSVRLFHVISSLFTHAYGALTAGDILVPSVSSSYDVRKREAPYRPYGGGGDYSNSNDSGLDQPPPPIESISPDASDIAARPTLLSRILHVDPDSLERRRAIELTFRHLCETRPEYMEQVKAFKRSEDLPLLRGTSFLKRRESRRGTSESSLANSSQTNKESSILSRLREGVVPISPITSAEKTCLEQLSAQQRGDKAHARDFNTRHAVVSSEEGEDSYKSDSSHSDSVLFDAEEEKSKARINR